MMMTQFCIENGILQGARQVASPNFNQRPAATDIRLVVIHNISLPPAQFGGGYIEQFFQNQLEHDRHPYFQTIRGMQVSAHVLILRTGEVLQFVNFNARSWHAGRSSYLGQMECNDYSIGIELEGCDDQPFAEVQYQQLSHIILAIEQAYPATRQHLAGHSDIAPVRKTDPGDCFDWQKLRWQISALRM
ncbi:MAG: 1,6-anhydro-N-acetylmuramyl-L-alanine amidase AmpD [Crocinitomicaceae bacterium]|nr:MAG: 1,6-anhydro-N-acetylmuramyl-L-alanine amidase AmpD [Crocinitomicaceae bacterium]